MKISTTNFFRGNNIFKVPQKQYENCDDIIDVVLITLSEIGTKKSYYYTHSFVYWNGAYNIKLSEKLTNAIKKYLINQKVLKNTFHR